MTLVARQYRGFMLLMAGAALNRIVVTVMRIRFEFGRLCLYRLPVSVALQTDGIFRNFPGLCLAMARFAREIHLFVLASESDIGRSNRTDSQGSSANQRRN